VDGDFPWVLAGALLLWIFNAIGGRKRTKVERPRFPPGPQAPPPVERRPQAMGRPLDPTQSEGGQLEQLLRALERQLAPAPAPAPPRTQPRPERGPLGRTPRAPMETAEELEERESLEIDPVVESLEREVRRPERVAPDRLGLAEAKERSRIAESEARDREPHKARHAGFDKRIRTTPMVERPMSRRLTTAEIRQAFIWGEILGRPKSGL
jgi:hypothetical protein